VIRSQPFAALLALLALLVSPVASAVDERTYPYDLSARVLPSDRLELGMFWGRVSKTLASGLQLTTHGLALAGAPNLYARWQFFDSPQIAASVEGGVLWTSIVQSIDSALSQANVPSVSLGPPSFFVPISLRGTAPLGEDLELTLAWRLESQLIPSWGGLWTKNNLRLDTTLVRSDASGAWIAQLQVPLFVQLAVFGDESGGSPDGRAMLTLDALSAWRFTVSREFVFPFKIGALADDAHLRLGAGFRNSPGIIFVESIGNVVFVADLYFR
jgi:hypothetical protein